MFPSSPVPFSELLRQWRRAAALSQEALAERAGLSVDAIRALERGRRGTPRPDTLAALARALDLAPPDRAALIAAALPGAVREAPARSVPSVAPAALLPVPPGALIGRDWEEAAILQLLRHDSHAEPPVRLLTLIGPGGVGKTRLALAVATTLRHAFADGVALVDLAVLRDPALVAQTVARALGIQDSGARDVRELLLAYLEPRHLLLLLDNVEGVVEAAPLLAEMIALCPRLTILATSRAPLRVRVEQRFRVFPLAVPVAAHQRSLEHVARASAVQLFVARAQAVDPAFQLDADTAQSVAQICARLDGLPLALELAASWIRLLPPAALLGRLDRRLTVLTGGARDLPARQRTLRDTLAWSEELLTPPERSLFAQLAVFEGGRSLEAIAAVCDPGGEADVLTCVEGLLEKSLLRQDTGEEGDSRFVMLETVHEYARERLEATGAAPALRRRHAAYFLDLAERGERELRGPEQGMWLAVLEREHGNLRAALRWAAAAREVELGLRLAGALWQFWQSHGYLSEGRDWLERLLAQADAGHVDAAVRARALAGAGWLAHRQNDFEQAATFLEESVALHRALGRQAGMADVLVNRGLVAHAQGDYARAAALLEEALALHRAQGDRTGVGTALSRLALVTRERGDYARATALYEECLALHRGPGHRAGIAGALLGLGDIARDRGDPDCVEVVCAQSLQLFRELGERWGIACSLNNLGIAACQRGDLARAAALLEESLALFRDQGIGGSIAEEAVGLGRVMTAVGEAERAAALLTEALRRARTGGPRWLIAASLEGLASLAVAQRQEARATRLLSAASALRATLGMPPRAADRAEYDATVSGLRATLGAGVWAALWAEAAHLPLEQIIDEALSL